MNPEKDGENLDLDQALDRLNAIMTAAQDAIITINPDGCVTSWNAAAERIFGYSRVEMLGKNLHRMLAPERYWPEHERAFPAFQRSGGGSAIDKTVELEAVRKDGIVIPIELSLSAFIHEKRWHAVGIVRDITDRKAADRARQNSERLLSELFQEMPVALYRTNPAGDILDANKALLEMFGYPDKPAMLALNAADLYVDRGQREAFRREVERTGIVKDMQVLLRRRDGTEINVLISARVVRDADGNIERFEGSLRDISERLKAEAEKKRAERLEVVGQLAAGIAHDFNNILAGIRGFAEYLAIRPQHEQKVRDAGERILLAMNRAAHIVDGLLTTLGTHIHNPTRVRLDEFVRGALELGPITAGRSVQVDMELSCGDLEIHADRERLETALRELVDNAVLASAEGGRVLVRTGLGRVEPAWVFAPQGELSGTWVWLSVIDQGCGMDEATLDRIFDPYFTTRGFGTGAGLGLTKVLGITRQHGGFIGVSSRPGQGTKATIYLPP